ncbi:MAG: RNA polymerase factor sigma-54 [Sinobacteraceae bacterium]|nr:RNA polymerase factor sigma-54 [Nevskiaceae bacterium]MCP5338798.1 RNA polymerase factor sigma-54 [Nevskiaceae bacterium]MCP5466287.1 RNA polymerase factor sigma-54 [Nevskiaceae bacterium]
MLKPSLQLKLGQQLTMTPQLQQAIRLLQMPALELQAHVRELLESNIMLEAVDETEATGVFEALTPPTVESPATDRGADQDEALAEVEIVDDNWSDRSSSPGESTYSGDDDRPQDVADAVGETLHEYLLGQLELAGLSPGDQAIASAIVDAINDDGYLIDSLTDIAATLRPEVEADEEEVERVLMLVQMLDPPGVGARSVSECILLQLGQLDPGTPDLALARSIAEHHLELVAERDLAQLKRALAAEDESVASALALVRGCHPRPGAIVGAGAPEYVVPDVFVRRTERGWAVELNPATVPRVRLNEGYASLIGRNSTHTTMRGQLQEARWLLKSLEIRNDTMLKVARAIVERQSDFLEQGEEYMRPMILKDIAEAISMHESTISRVTSGKYMLTPRGVFELRYFFSSQVESEGGQGTSSTAIRAKIRKLVREEAADSPLSDSRIAEILSGEGIPVARRTVAKYREAMGIASSAERKRAAAR